ncbi:MAG: WD40 repeat domain-containing protein [Acidobacteriota bacterium]
MIKGFDGPVRSISFSPDGQTIVSGSNEYRTSKIQETAQSHEGSVSSDVKWWDAKTGELKRQITLPSKGSISTRAMYSPDGKQVGIVESFMDVAFLPTNPNLTGAGAPFGVLPPMFLTGIPHAFYNADLKLLDAQTGELKLKLKLNTNRPTRAIFSPDGSLIAAWNNREVILLNVQTGREEHKLRDFKGQLNTIAFSPDGLSLAVADNKYERISASAIGAKSEVQVFDVRTWKVTASLKNLGVVNSLTFGPNGRVLLAGGLIGVKDGAFPGVKLLDLQNGSSALLSTGNGADSEVVDSLVLSGNGSLLALQCGQETVKMVDTNSWQTKQTFDANSVGADKGKPSNRFVLSVRRALAVAFSSDGNTVMGELEQGEVKLWDLRTGEVKKKLDGDDEEPSLVAIAADASTVAEVSNGTLRVGNVKAEARRTLPVPTGGSISSIALSPDGQTLAAGVGKELKILQVATGDLEKTLPHRWTALSHLEFSSDGVKLAAVDGAGMIEIWNVASGSIERTIDTGAGVTALRFSPNGQALATANANFSVTLWNLQTGLPQQRLQKHEAQVNALAFSLDGQFLASGGDDRKVVVWETASGRSKRTLKGHDQTVTSLAFSRDGRLLASGSGNASVVLWDVTTGKLNRILK